MTASAVWVYRKTQKKSGPKTFTLPHLLVLDYFAQVCLRNAYLCGFSDQAKAVKGDVMDVRFCAEASLDDLFLAFRLPGILR